MIRRWMVAVAATSALGVAVACGPDKLGPNSRADAGIPDGHGDSGVPDAGDIPDAAPPDAGEDGGVDAGFDAGPGPWPLDEVTHFSGKYGIDSIQSVGVDDAQNIWLLRGDRIGVLRPGTSAPVWTTGVGQAAGGFGEDRPALGSTVICGGAAGLAYVGYAHHDSNQGEILDGNDPKLSRGDLDIVQLNADGTVSLLEHMYRSTGTSTPWPPANTGIRNSNNWHLNEDVTVLTCQRVTRGRFKGELYIGTNHGVTRIRGLEYCSHRHPIWMDGTTEKIGYSYGLGIAQNGEVLIANEWMVGITDPPEQLGDWEFFGPPPDRGAPWALNTWNQELNSKEEMDYWRAFENTTDGQYYLGSSHYGLWRMERTQWSGSANWFKVTGIPSENINALAATDDGSLFIGTDDAGLWRMDPQKKITRFDRVPGSRIRQLVYDPTVKPAALYVVSGDQLYVIRNY